MFRIAVFFFFSFFPVHVLIILHLRRSICCCCWLTRAINHRSAVHVRESRSRGHLLNDLLRRWTNVYEYLKIPKSHHQIFRPIDKFFYLLTLMTLTFTLCVCESLWLIVLADMHVCRMYESNSMGALYAHITSNICQKNEERLTNV